MRISYSLATALAFVQLIASSADDMSLVLERTRVTFGWPADDAIAGTVSTAQAYASTLNSTCFWTDINYFDKGPATWAPSAHVTRVQTMVQALTAPTSTAFENSSLSLSVHCALGVWLSNDWTSPNWWWQWIGIENTLQATFLMLGTNRTSASEQSALIARSMNSAWWVDDWTGGANLISMLQIQIMRGAASDNVTAVTQAFTTLWPSAVMGNVSRDWQGIVQDFSYHFHGQQILNSAYGIVWLESLLQFYQIAAGTQWAMPDEYTSLMAAYIAEGNALISYGGRFDWGSYGRGISRPGTSFAWGLSVEAMQQLAAQPGAAPWQTQLQNFASRVSGVIPPQDFISNKYFWTSDFHAHHRPGWGAALKMHGDNGNWTVEGNECDNGENLLGEYTSDGVLNVYASDEASVASDTYEGIFPLLDWHVLNGVTAEVNSYIKPCGADTGFTWPKRNTAFVGGVSDGQFGAAAMDSATHNTTSQRSWFFFDSAIVALATNLTNGGFGGNVWTTLASRLVPNATKDPVRGPLTAGFFNGSVNTLDDGTYAFPLSGTGAGAVRWLNVGGLGIVPAVPGTGNYASAPILGVEVGQKTAPWSIIGPGTGSSTGRLFTSTLQHGTQLPPDPEGSLNGYAYLLFPNVTAQEMPDMVSLQGGTQCIIATPTVHGASSLSNEAMVIFWADGGGTYGCASQGMKLNMTSDSKGMVLYNEGQGSGMAVQVSVAHPTRLGGVMRITVSRSASGSACSAGPGQGETTFTLPLPTDVNMMGSTVTAACRLS